MFEFHADRKRYFEIQVLNAEKYVIPFIEEKFSIQPGMRVLERLAAVKAECQSLFINKGCTGVGVELDTPRIDDALKFLPDDGSRKK